LAEQSAGIRKELHTTRERLETLERKVDEPSTPKPSPASDDEPW